MWIKICGVTRTKDVLAVIHSGADAIGFNFFPQSKRFVSIATARTLAIAARQTSKDSAPVDLVGVFVNAMADTVKETVESVGLNAIQLHGDETPEHVAIIHDHCPALPIVRAFRVHPKNPEHTLTQIDALASSFQVSAILLDAFVPGEFGGTGAVVDLSILPIYFEKPRPPLILAGGLTPANVASVASRAKVWGIDTASGVESSPGIKDQTMIDELVKAARGVLNSDPMDLCVRIDRPPNAGNVQPR